jgi:dCMP deaminase
MTDRYDRYFLQLCHDTAKMSKDPSTQVGAVIVDQDRIVRATGFNGFPRGVHDDKDRYENRELKHKMVVHGEMNAMMAAARVGVPLKGCTLYLSAHDSMQNHRKWGGPPCHECTKHLIQAGITEIVSLPAKDAPERWQSSLALAAEMLYEAGVTYHEVS